MYQKCLWRSRFASSHKNLIGTYFYSDLFPNLVAMKAWAQEKRDKQAWYFDILISAWLLSEH